MAQQHHESLDINYLIKENRKLRMELKQTQNLAQLHKEAVTKMSQNLPKHSVIKLLTDIIQGSGKEGVQQGLRDTIFALEGQIMVLQKIVNQTYQNQKQTYLLLVDQFKKIQDENTRMDLQLHKFYQKIGQVDYLSGLVTKNKEVRIISPTEQAIAFRKQQEQMLDMLNLQKDTIRRLTDEKEKLIKINVHMKQQVQRKKDQVKNMTMMILNDERNFENNQSLMILNELDIDNEENRDQKKHQNLSVLHNASKINLSQMSMSQTSNLNTTINFVKLQRQLIKEVDEQNINEDSDDSDEDMDCPQLAILFPDKVKKIKINRHEAKIPYLNMKKVRELMMKREEKMRKDIEAQNHHLNPTNKIIQLQTQLQITRKQLTNQMLKFRTMSDEMRILTLHVQELQQRNQLLLKSNEGLSKNYKNIYSDYQLCKSITNEVQKIIGKKITNEKSMRNAREELTTILIGGIDENDSDQLKFSVNKALKSIFKQKAFKRERGISV